MQSLRGHVFRDASRNAWAAMLGALAASRLDNCGFGMWGRGWGCAGRKQYHCDFVLYWRGCRIVALVGAGVHCGSGVESRVGKVDGGIQILQLQPWAGYLRQRLVLV